MADGTSPDFPELRQPRAYAPLSAQYWRKLDEQRACPKNSSKP
jgi:hypothetical protein